MRNFLCIAMVVTIIAGCKSKIPENIIEPIKVESVLYDIHIADAYISTISNQDSAKKVASAYYKGIYKKFKIDSASYTKSMNFYYDHPDILTEMYKNVNASLKKTKDSLDKIETKRLANMSAADKKKAAALAKKLAADSIDKIGLVKLDTLKSSRKLRRDSLAKVEKDKASKLQLKKKLEKDSVQRAKRLIRTRRGNPALKVN